jgi:hypothetical protein
MTVIYKDNGSEISVGDSVILAEPCKGGFYNSSIGKLFEAGVCDKAVLVVKQRDWLEVYFYLTLLKGEKVLSNCEVHQEDPIDDESDHEDWYEHTDYTFMRYLLNKGAEINPA